jgi:hypothetical protein
MASTTAPDVPNATQGGDPELPRWRIHLLRATYAIFVVPALVMIPLGSGPLPRLILHAPADRGMINGIQAGLFVMCAIGLRHPLKMLPILLFEVVWKLIWLLAYGLPQWQSGVRSAQWSEDIILIGAASILGVLIIPWTYVFRHYLKAPAERWR